MAQILDNQLLIVILAANLRSCKIICITEGYGVIFIEDVTRPHATLARMLAKLTRRSLMLLSWNAELTHEVPLRPGLQQSRKRNERRWMSSADRPNRTCWKNQSNRAQGLLIKLPFAFI